MKIEEILNKVEDFNKIRNYWFVRTAYGKYFDPFYDGNYVGIGWGYVTLKEFKSLADSEIRSKIAIKEGLDVIDSRQRGKVTAIYNKIDRFINLKKGDIIIVPSRKSERLAFGEILDDAPFENYDDTNDEKFVKRRKVRWIENKSIYELDPMFFQLKINQHTISDIGRYAPYIDKVIGNLYKKGDNTHFILNIEKKDDIYFRELSSLMDNIEELLADINSTFDFKENENEFFVKMNLQSPGKMEIIRNGKSLAVLAYLLFMTSCGNPSTEIKDPTLRDFQEKNAKKVGETVLQLDSMEINYKEMHQPFENGK